MLYNKCVQTCQLKLIPNVSISIIISKYACRSKDMITNEIFQIFYP